MTRTPVRGGAPGRRLRLPRSARAADDLCTTDGLPLLTAEVERARRYERPLALVRLADGGRGAATHPALHAYVCRISRSLDGVWCDADGVLVVMPEVETQQGLCGAERWVSHFADDAHVAVLAACFPRDGLTVGALLEAVRPRRARLERVPPSQPARPGAHQLSSAG